MFKALVRFGCLASVAVQLAAPAMASGTGDEAEVNFALGAEAFVRGDLRAALAFFLASDRLAPNANVRYNIARSYERLGEYPEAFRWYASAAVSGDEQTWRESQTALVDLAPKVARLDVQTTPPGATIYVDRQELGSVGVTPRPLALTPGEHDILVVAEGYRPHWERGVTLTLGQTAMVSVVLSPLLGAVRVVSEPGLGVFVDGEATSRCTTPCSVQLEPRRYRIVVSGDGKRSAPVSVQVEADALHEIEPMVQTVTGELLVTAAEAGAAIEVDGKVVGYAPAMLRLPVGERSVRLVQPGFSSVERVVRIVEGEQLALDTTPMRGEAEVEAASRVREPLRLAPSSISVITGAELRAFAYPTIYEALRGTRGMALSADSTYSSAAVRGLGQPNDFGNRLLILQDGATLNDNILWQSFIGYDGRVDLGDVERIEVVRGPGSVLYGTGAVSGVVNLVTREPDAGRTSHASVGSYDNGVARGRVGGSIGDAQRGAWLSLAAARGQGRDLDLTLRRGVTQPIEQAEQMVAATTAGKAWFDGVTLQWLVTRREQQVPTGAYGARYNDDEHVWIDQRSMVELKAEPRLSERVSLMTRLYGNHYRYDGRLPYDGDDPDANDLAVEVYDGLWAGAEARATYANSDKLRLSVGAESQYSFNASIRGDYIEGNGDVDRYVDEAQPYGLLAAYGAMDASVNKALRLSLGGRLDAWTTTAPTFNPRAAVIVSPSATDTVKLMGGRAFRAPSVYELRFQDGVAQVRSDYDGTTLRPESTWSGELEYSRRLGDDWTALGSAHGSITDGLIGTVPVAQDSGLVVYRNSDREVLALGADVELRRELRHGWLFSTTGGLLRTVYLDDTQSTVPNAPPVFGALKLIAPLGDQVRVAFRGTVEGPRRISEARAATTDPALIGDIVISGQSQSGAVEYSFGSYNVFNWKYEMPLSGIFDARTMPQAGRSFLASLTVRDLGRRRSHDAR